MKFKWKLEKVLEIRKKQEQILKSELFEITQKQLQIKQKIMLEQMQIRSAVSMMSDLPLDQRMSMQSNFIDFSFNIKKNINILNKQLSEVDKKKKVKLEENIIARKNRMALEKLKENEYEKFMQQQKKNELNFLDDITSTKFTREKLGLN